MVEDDASSGEVALGSAAATTGGGTGKNEKDCADRHGAGGRESGRVRGGPRTIALMEVSHELRMCPRARGVSGLLLLSAFLAFGGCVLLRSPDVGASSAGTASQIHYTFTGPTEVVFDWQGTAAAIRYGRTARYGSRVVAGVPAPVPFSSPGPFREAKLRRLRPGTTYHYSIGGQRDRTFATAPTGRFRFVVQGDVGDSVSNPVVAATQAQIAAERPAFVIVAGDLTYGNENGQAAVDRHFDDVMVWSRSAAYMPAWGNHDWHAPEDDLRNYKGRFAIPHGQASPGAPAAGCCGEDWGWFDAGGVRFISYPEPYEDATWTDWQARAARVIADAEGDPGIRFVVTYGHRPAYSSGHHAGDRRLASILDSFGDRFRKYVLNLNAHSHDYERFAAIHGVVHVTASGGGAQLQAPWRRDDPRTAFRSLHLEHLRVDVTPNALILQAVCGPATKSDETSCPSGSVIDSVTISPR